MIFSQLSRPMRAGGFALIGVAAVAVVIGAASAVTGGDGDERAEPAAPTDGPQAGDGQDGPVPVPGEENGDDDAPTTTTTEADGDDASEDDDGSTDGNGDGGDGDGGDGDGDGGSGDGDGDGGSGDGDGEAADDESADGSGSPDSRPGSSGGADRSSPGSNGNERVGRGSDGADAHRSVAVRVYNNSTISGLAGDVSDDLRASGWNVVATNNYSGGKIPTTTAYYRPGTGEKAAAEALAREFDMRVEARFDGIADASGGVIVIVTNDYQGPSGKS